MSPERHLGGELSTNGRDEKKEVGLPTVNVAIYGAVVFFGVKLTLTTGT